MQTNAIKNFFVYWSEVAKLALLMAFGEKFIRAFLIWVITFSVAFLVVGKLDGVGPAVENAAKSALISTTVLVLVFLFCLIRAPVKMHGPVKTRKALVSLYKMLGEYTMQFHEISNELNAENSIEVDEKYKRKLGEVVSRLREFQLDQSWVDNLLSDARLSTIRMKHAMSFGLTEGPIAVPKIMSAPFDLYNETQCKLENTIDNLKQMRENMNNHILKTYAPII